MAKLYHDVAYNHSTEPGNVHFKNSVDPDLLCCAMPYERNHLSELPVVNRHEWIIFTSAGLGLILKSTMQ